jgi:hypothetical protein
MERRLANQKSYETLKQKMIDPSGAMKIKNELDDERRALGIKTDTKED